MQSLCHGLFMFGLLQAGSSVVDEHTISLLSNVSHLAGYEATSPFEHVEGSACCLDAAVHANGMEACKNHCVQQQGCGSFLFSRDEGQCYLISEHSNFQPADGPQACEQRCGEQKACEAFVFTPSTQLCFLVRFAEEVSTPHKASIRPADDRIFGLVRDTPSGSIQAAISRSLLRHEEADGERAFISTIYPLAAAKSHTGNVSNCSSAAGAQNGDMSVQGLPMNTSWQSTVQTLSNLSVVAQSLTIDPNDISPRFLHKRLVSVLAAFLLAALAAVARFPMRGRVIILAQLRRDCSVGCTDDSTRVGQSLRPTSGAVACDVGSPSSKGEILQPLSPQVSTAPPSPEAVDSETEKASQASEDSPNPESIRQRCAASQDDLFGPGASSETCRESPQVVTMPKADFTWRERQELVPERRKVGFVGATNYPVTGEVSPHARAAPPKLLLRELVELAEAVSTEESFDKAQDRASLDESAADSCATFGAWLLECALVLSALLFGALVLEPKTFNVAALGLCAALPLRSRLATMWHSEGKVQSGASD